MRTDERRSTTEACQRLQDEDMTAEQFEHVENALRVAPEAKQFMLGTKGGKSAKTAGALPDKDEEEPEKAEAAMHSSPPSAGSSQLYQLLEEPHSHTTSIQAGSKTLTSSFLLHSHLTVAKHTCLLVHCHQRFLQSHLLHLRPTP